MSAVNYARHASLRRYVFLAKGESPDPSWLSPEWAWWHAPSAQACLIGETPEQSCERTGHAIGRCSRCRARAAGLAAAKGGER